MIQKKHSTVTKDFDSIEQKRKAQEAILLETKGMKPEEEIAYFHRVLAQWDHLKVKQQKKIQSVTV